MSILEDMEGSFLNGPCMEYLGDTIRYKPAGGAWASKHAYVDHADQARSIDGGLVIDQNMTVTVLIEDVPTKPSSSCRVEISRVPGYTFRPVNVGRDQSGTHWVFELEQVVA